MRIRSVFLVDQGNIDRALLIQCGISVDIDLLGIADFHRENFSVGAEIKGLEAISQRTGLIAIRAGQKHRVTGRPEIGPGCHLVTGVKVQTCRTVFRPPIHEIQSPQGGGK